MKEITKHYTNGEVNVIWKAHVCKHSQICWRGLSAVFKPGTQPWIKMEGASTAEIIEQVKKCPSGALSFNMNKEPDSTI